jgi:hypothetical protein
MDLTCFSSRVLLLYVTDYDTLLGCDSILGGVRFFEAKRHQILKFYDYRSVQQENEFVVYFNGVRMSLAIPVGLLHKDRTQIQNAFLDLIESLKTLA